MNIEVRKDPVTLERYNVFVHEGTTDVDIGRIVRVAGLFVFKANNYFRHCIFTASEILRLGQELDKLNDERI